LAFLKQRGRADLWITKSGNLSDPVMFEQSKILTYLYYAFHLDN
jgi:hypothetical protein